MLKKYSPSHFKYEKKITIQTDKHTYTYHISDIHYEIDMSLLGCNSKILWNEIFLQIVDIISVKAEKVGFIVCKNFHMIHGETVGYILQLYTTIFRILFVKIRVRRQHHHPFPHNNRECEFFTQ
jgi:hypothetical protein